MSAISSTNTLGVSTQQPSSLLVDALSNKVNAICSHLSLINSIEMQKELEELYLEGLKLIRSEVNLIPLINFTPTDIVDKLNHQLNWEHLQSRDDVHMSLSKTHRIFLELVWVKSSLAKESIPRKSRENLLDKIMANLKLVPQKYPSTRFESECTLQAAKALQAFQGLIDHQEATAINLALNTTASSFADVLSNLKLMAQNINKALYKKWYLDIHDLRWSATAIRSIQDFDKVFSPIQALFEKNGYEYTLGLATTYMDIIRNPEAEDIVKIETAKRLCELAKLRDGNIKNYLFAKAGKLTSVEALLAYGKKCDKYYKTRLLVKEYITSVRLNTPSLRKDVDFNIVEPAIGRASEITPDAFAKLLQEYNSLESYINETEQFIQDTRDILTLEEQAEREKEVILAKEELQEAYEERETSQEKILTEVMLRLVQEEMDEFNAFESSITASA